MNTGIQDAWNLGWKVALVVRGAAAETLLDSYEAERWPVGRTLLRSTDRAFSMFTRAMSAGPIAAWIRRTIGPRLAPRALGSARVRALIFRFVSELGINYRKSPAVREGQPRLRAGPAAGDRLPDARIVRDGRDTYLQQELSGPCVHLLLCGPIGRWSRDQIATLRTRYADLLAVQYLDRQAAPGVLVDTAGEALSRLGLPGDRSDVAQYLVRPDGYIGFRCGGADLAEAAGNLEEWFLPAELAATTEVPTTQD
jgi:FAD binding domain-containing protein